MNIDNAITAVRHFEALGRLGQPDTGGFTRYQLQFAGMQLYKRLLKIERKMNRIAVMQCNGERDQDKLEKQWEKGKEQVTALIIPKYHNLLHFNGDPRGYTLKLEYSKDGSARAPEELTGLHTDFGGYGILAPDF